MEEWKEYNFNDITINYDKNRIPLSSKERETKKGEYRYFGAQGVIDYIDNYIFDGQYILLAEDGENLKSKKQSLVQFVSGKFWVNNHAHILTGNEKCDIRFLFYLLDSMDFTPFITGSAQPKLSQQSLSKIYLKIPPLPIQQKIAAILSSLDDKIELNNKINTNLEQQAQALFKNWFVDFEPFGGKMPEGWKVGKLSEYCTFQEGYVNPAQTHNEYFDGDVKWLRAVDINESFILNTSRTLTKCGFESAGKSAFLFKPGSIAISKSGTVGRLGIISDFMCGNRAVIGIELKDQQNLSYIYQYLKSRQTEFPDMAVGSVQKNLYVSILENLDIIIPSKEVLDEYAKICMPFYDQVKTNCIESNNLISIRDTLLPKLMNGEIEI